MELDALKVIFRKSDVVDQLSSKQLLNLH